jgi:hypothetical protein
METIDFKQETENLKKSFIDYLDMVNEMVKGEVKEDNPVLDRNNNTMSNAIKSFNESENLLDKSKKVFNIQNETKFKAGDKVTFILDSEDVGIIKMVDLTSSVVNYMVSWNKRRAVNDGYFTASQLIPYKELKKEVLFTTVDGVGISKGDLYFSVSDNFDVLFTQNVQYTVSYANRTFSKCELAAEWILMNKPLLSLNDLLSVWNEGKPVDRSNSIMFELFKGIAKEKLNK